MVQCRKHRTEVAGGKQRFALAVSGGCCLNSKNRDAVQGVVFEVHCALPLAF